MWKSRAVPKQPSRLLPSLTETEAVTNTVDDGRPYNDVVEPEGTGRKTATGQDIELARREDTR